MSFKGITHECLLWMSVAHNKNLNILLILQINCILEKLAPQILSIKVECTFLFLNFLIVGLFNSVANSLFDIFPFLALPPEAFLSKNL